MLLARIACVPHGGTPRPGAHVRVCAVAECVADGSCDSGSSSAAAGAARYTPREPHAARATRTCRTRRTHAPRAHTHAGTHAHVEPGTHAARAPRTLFADGSCDSGSSIPAAEAAHHMAREPHALPHTARTRTQAHTHNRARCSLALMVDTAY